MEKKRYPHPIYSSGARKVTCKLCGESFHHGQNQMPQIKNECSVLIREALESVTSELEEKTTSIGKMEKIVQIATEQVNKPDAVLQKQFKTDAVAIWEELGQAEQAANEAKEVAKMIHLSWKERCLDEAIWSSDYQNRWIQSQQLIDGIKRTLKTVEEKVVDKNIKQIITAALKAVDSRQADDVTNITKQYEIFRSQLEKISNDNENKLKR